MAQTKMRLRHANRKIIKAKPGIQRNLFLRRWQILHTGGTIHIARDRLNLRFYGNVQRVKEFEFSGQGTSLYNRPRQFHRTLSTICPVAADHRILRTRLARNAPH